VKFNVFDSRQGKWGNITDRILNDPLVTRPGEFAPWNCSKMRFVAFLRMPSNGIEVEGAGP
jgi:hypothetical protein